MSIYQARNGQGKLKSPYWQYDFTVKVLGRSSERFHGSTGQKTKAAAKRYEDRIKELAALGQLSSDMTVNDACWKYWDEVGQFEISAKVIATNLEYVRRLLGYRDDGKDRLLVALRPADIAAAAAKRLQIPVQRMRIMDGEKRLAPAMRNGSIWMPSQSTANRNIVEPIQQILFRAKRIWRVPIDIEIFDWKELTFPEAAERNRQISVEEEARAWRHLREDYHALVEMHIVSGRRLSDWMGLWQRGRRNRRRGQHGRRRELRRSGGWRSRLAVVRLEGAHVASLQSAEIWKRTG